MESIHLPSLYFPQSSSFTKSTQFRKLFLRMSLSRRMHVVYVSCGGILQLQPVKINGGTFKKLFPSSGYIPSAASWFCLALVRHRQFLFPFLPLTQVIQPPSAAVQMCFFCNLCTKKETMQRLIYPWQSVFWLGCLVSKGLKHPIIMSSLLDCRCDNALYVDCVMLVLGWLDQVVKPERHVCDVPSHCPLRVLQQLLHLLLQPVSSWLLFLCFDLKLPEDKVLPRSFQRLVSVRATTGRFLKLEQMSRLFQTLPSAVGSQMCCCRCGAAQTMICRGLKMSPCVEWVSESDGGNSLWSSDVGGYKPIS